MVNFTLTKIDINMKFFRTALAIIICTIYSMASVIAQNTDRVIIQLDPIAETCRFSTPDSILTNDMGAREVFLIIHTSEEMDNISISLNNNNILSEQFSLICDSYYKCNISSGLDRVQENLLINNSQTNGVDELFVVITNGPHINYSKTVFAPMENQEGGTLTTSAVVSGTNGKMFQITTDIQDETGNRIKSLAISHITELGNGDAQAEQNFTLPSYGTYKITHTLYYIPALKRESKANGVQARKYICEKFSTTIRLSADTKDFSIINTIGREFEKNRVKEEKIKVQEQCCCCCCQ